MIFRCPNIQTDYNEAVLCLNFGTPESNEFSIWDKWKIYYFLGVLILMHIRVNNLNKNTMYRLAALFSVPLLFVLHCLTGNQKRKWYFVKRSVIFQNNAPHTFCHLYTSI